MVTQLYGDALFNVPHGRGPRGMMVRLLGSSGRFHMSPIGKLFLLRDKEAFRGWLREQAARNDLVRIIPGHGEIVDRDVAARLSEAAVRL